MNRMFAECWGVTSFFTFLFAGCLFTGWYQSLGFYPLPLLWLFGIALIAVQAGFLATLLHFRNAQFCKD